MIYLRLANESDFALIMAWRSNPLIYQGFYSQKEPLKWDEHISWLKFRNRDWREFIIDSQEDDIIRPVGVITIGQLDHWSPEIGILIGNPTDWGKGFGKLSLALTFQWLREYNKGYVHTTILDSNERSISLFKGCGFEYLGKAREGESWYQKRL